MTNYSQYLPIENYTSPKPSVYFSILVDDIHLKKWWFVQGGIKSSSINCVTTLNFYEPYNCTVDHSLE